MTPPQASDESADPDRFWKPDASDHLLPGPGWISDCVYNMRGTQVPTLYTIWSCLWALSSAAKRDCWLDWHEDRLFPNLYVILVGPPGIPKKTFMIQRAVAYLDGSIRHLKATDPVTGAEKDMHIVRDKVTPEGILAAMAEQQVNTITQSDGTLARDTQGSIIQTKMKGEVALVVPEMTVTINSREYAKYVITHLLDLYDPRGAEGFHFRTASKGLTVVPYTYVTFLMGTTPVEFRDTVPTTGKGSGFLSRTILVYHGMTNRRFDHPRIVKLAPSKQQLAERLAWIAGESKGRWAMEPAAAQWYGAWYNSWCDFLESAGEESAGLLSRVDNHVQKIALLLRLQRYDARDGLITLADVKHAVLLMQHVTTAAAKVISQLQTDPSLVHSEKLWQYLKERGTVTRRRCLQGLHMHSRQLQDAVEQLLAEGRLQVSLGGSVLQAPSHSGHEEYTCLDVQDHGPPLTAGFSPGNTSPPATSARRQPPSESADEPPNFTSNDLASLSPEEIATLREQDRLDQ